MVEKFESFFLSYVDKTQNQDLIFSKHCWFLMQL